MRSASFEDFESALRRIFYDLRVASGATQAELAKRNGTLTQSTIAKFENGDSPNVTLRTVYELAKACGAAFADVVRLAERGQEEAAREDAWTLVASEIAAFPPNKRKRLAKIVHEIIRDED